jgi:hypothetical protein
MIARIEYLAATVLAADDRSHSLTRDCTSARLTASIRIPPRVGRMWLDRTVPYVEAVLAASTWRWSHRWRVGTVSDAKRHHG